MSVAPTEQQLVEKAREHGYDIVVVAVPGSTCSVSLMKGGQVLAVKDGLDRLAAVNAVFPAELRSGLPATL
jgi:hypothetical protein